MSVSPSGAMSASVTWLRYARPVTAATTAPSRPNPMFEYLKRSSTPRTAPSVASARRPSASGNACTSCQWSASAPSRSTPPVEAVVEAQPSGLGQLDDGRRRERLRVRGDAEQVRRRERDVRGHVGMTVRDGQCEVAVGPDRRLHSGDPQPLAPEREPPIRVARGVAGGDEVRAAQNAPRFVKTAGRVLSRIDRSRNTDHRSR